MKPFPIQVAWNGAADCRTCSVRESVLFAGLKEEEFSLIHLPIDDLTFPPQSPLYLDGQAGEALFTVRQGLVKLEQTLADGTTRIVRLLQSGDVAGMEALLGQPYAHTAICLHETKVCRLPRAVIERLDRESPRLHRALLTRWHRALSQADAWLTELSTGPARARVARLLLRLSDTGAQSPCTLFSREDMGAMLGITTETASRVIAEFKRGGLLRGNPGAPTCDRDGLQAVANSVA
ncbi:MAG: Crp/Fnr family transcriptional regulator [Alphaproteobacteria bacterium CG_4_10_14_0_2_um_filter_63_37]|nr:MAG: Crp/Fnr family transcriptional regulator [Proteobacteria bacterium CG1_02_64_396]PJA23829.1 MAG: Crp/Fnr family transcriptional regulator [Alphaproteobacteria bacterium CG_4_10_14_0_2_um_filter_63_37]